MATQSLVEPDGGTEDRGPGRQAALIARSVLRALGRPPDFLRATVRAVGADAFRVNVMTGPDLSAVRIAHSFFVTADGDGNLLAASPAVTRVYPA